MDRSIFYPGEIPRSSDVLNAQKYAMTAIAKLAGGILGTSILLNGLACTPTSPASMTVQVEAGEIYALSAMDATDYGSVVADTTHQILKQGIVLDTQTFSTPAPATSGHAINYLIQVGYADQDVDSELLPYYNASNPSVAWSGPSNTGVAQYTTRKGACVVGIKTGVSALAGIQVTPTPDVGYVGAWVVTVLQGATTVISGDISQYPTAPFLTETLLEKISQATADTRYAQITNVQQSSYTYAEGGGSTTAYTATYSPAITALVDGMQLNVDIGSVGTNTTTTPTFSPNGLTAHTIKRQGGDAVRVGDIPNNAILQYDSTATTWILLNPNFSNSLPAGSIIPYTASTSSAPTGWLFADGSALSRTAYADLFKVLVTDQGYSAQTFTVTIAAPCVFTKSAHGFVTGERLRLSTTGALPTGLNTTTDYFVEVIDTNTFYLTTSVFGVAIRVATSGSQSGTHSYTQSMYGLGDGTTTFNIPDLRGLFIRGQDKGRGIDINRAMGTCQNGTIEYKDTWIGTNDINAGVIVTNRHSSVLEASLSTGVDIWTSSLYLDDGLAAAGYATPSGTSLNGLSAGVGGIAGISRPSNMTMPYLIKY